VSASCKKAGESKKNKKDNCSTFKAIEDSPLSSYKNYDESGVFLCSCALHDTPLRASDMFGGEKFSYLDVLAEEMLESSSKKCQIKLYYDIGCRYEPHLRVFFYVLTVRN
jgi:hypothetical protein